MGILVKVENGTVRGATSTDYNHEPFYCFYGVPYAKPPIGNLRFKAPVILENWDGIKDCTKVKEGCISRHMLTRKFTGSEDCLFLNIYTKDLSTTLKDNLKPVLVWIHGGKFITGSGNPDLHGPEFLITQNIVIVTVTYRLGALGHLCLENESFEIDRNAGYKDVLMALKWINKNIGYFNGNPENVTIAGQSVGGSVVHCLLLTSLSDGLFHKAILQSGSAFFDFIIGQGLSAKELAKKLKFNSDDEHELITFLRNTPAIDLLKSSEKIYKPSQDLYINSTFPFSFVLETPHSGAILTEKPLITTLKGHYRRVPLLMGYTDQEGLYGLFMIRKLKVIVDNFENMVPSSLELKRGSQLSKSKAKKIQEFYFGNEIATQENKLKYVKMTGDVCGKYPTYKAAKSLIKNSHHPIYFYKFSVDTNLNLYKKLQKANIPGATHADDICYLFKMELTPEIKPGSVEDLNIRRMTKLWGNFIKTGDPNPSSPDPLIQTYWKPITDKVMHYVRICNDGLVADEDPDKEEMAFWDEIYQLDSSYLNHKL